VKKCAVRPGGFPASSPANACALEGYTGDCPPAFLRAFSLLRCGNALFYQAHSTLKILNAEFCKKALEKVGNPNVLINLVSRRVRQLTSGGGGLNRPLVTDIAGLGAADIALLEIINEKTGWEMPELSDVEKPSEASRRRKRH
jgi:DNA-directed RNA polymerase subunit omega